VSERTLVLATRGSRLALAQSEWVAREIEAHRPDVRVRLEVVRTRGDRVLDAALHEVGGKGLFVKEIEEALLAGRADIAVHSMKDLPSESPSGLALGAVTVSEDPRDVLVAREGAGLDALREGAAIGTSSLRRAAQLLHHRPDLEIRSIRGNVDTRLRKLADESLDAIVLAAAGLLRLGLTERVTEYLSPDVCLPAAGQGMLAIEIRDDDEVAREVVAFFDCHASRVRSSAERSALAALGGGCQTPIGLYGEVTSGRVRLRGVVSDPRGARLRRAETEGPCEEAEALGQALARMLTTP